MEEKIEYIGEDIPFAKDEDKTPQNELGQAGGDSNDVVKGEVTEVKSLALYDQMAKTWELTIEDLIPLVNPPPGGVTSPGLAQMVRTASINYGIPISGFNFIPIPKTGKYSLYINAAGIQFRLATDPRGLESITPVIEHMPDLEKEKDYICIKTTIKMKDGSYADDYGISEWPPMGRNRQMDLGDLVMKLITKSIRRASTRLVGTTLPVYDEDYLGFIMGAGKNIVDAEYKVIKPKKTEPTTLNELIVMAGQVDESLDVDVLIKMMDVNVMDDLRDIVKETWDKIQEGYGTDVEE